MGIGRIVETRDQVGLYNSYYLVTISDKKQK